MARKATQEFEIRGIPNNKHTSRQAIRFLNNPVHILMPPQLVNKEIVKSRFFRLLKKTNIERFSLNKRAQPPPLGTAAPTS
jgi:hypothetical protein